MIHNIAVFIWTYCFFLVYLKPKLIAAINKIPAIIDPELKGSPMVFTKKISSELKYLKMFGANNLKMNNRIATTVMLAIIKFLRVTSL